MNGGTSAAVDDTNKNNQKEGSKPEAATITTTSGRHSLEEYSYNSPHDSPLYVRSLAKAFGQLEDRPPSVLVAMAIGVPDFPDLLTTPPFSEITSKAVQETYVPISELLKREILRRSYFLLNEIDHKRTDHPLRDGSMRLRMPQPAQWNRDRLLKFLEEKVIDLHEKDLQFLRLKMGEVKIEIAQHVRAIKARREAEAQQAIDRGAAHPRRRRTLEALPAPLGLGTVPPTTDAPEELPLSATATGRSVGEGASGSGSSESDEWTERVSKRLYGAANGLEMVEGLSDVEALDALDFLLSHKQEAVQFLQVGRAYYQPKGESAPPEAALDKTICDLSRYSQRKKAKMS